MMRTEQKLDQVFKELKREVNDSQLSAGREFGSFFI